MTCILQARSESLFHSQLKVAPSPFSYKCLHRCALYSTTPEVSPFSIFMEAICTYMYLNPEQAAFVTW
jgi:hypothetical protein